MKERTFYLESFVSGIGRFCVGLGKKILIANTLAVACKIYAEMADKTVLMTWVYAISFSLQIYFDFSGYSDMAIGLGKLFGFSFPENFNYPFIAKSVTEFWRRWHMTLGVWFRDYVYIPMGGNRVKAGRFVLNILVVWFLTGLWHGAEYNFVLWGLYYGLLLLLEKFLLKKPLQLSRVLSHIYLLLLTILGFVLFDAASISEALRTAGRLFGIGAALTNTVSSYYARGYALVIVIASFLATPLARQAYTALKKHRAGKQVCSWLEPVASLLLLVLSTAYLVDGSYNPFMYFRF